MTADMDTSGRDPMARARAAARGMSTPELISLLDQGPSAIDPGKWDILDDELRRRHRMRESSADFSEPQPAEVVVTDIRMPFWSMVWFMVKWSLASIPAFIILFTLAGVMVLLFITMFGRFAH